MLFMLHASGLLWWSYSATFMHYEYSVHANIHFVMHVYATEGVMILLIVLIGSVNLKLESGVGNCESRNAGTRNGSKMQSEPEINAKCTTMKAHAHIVKVHTVIGATAKSTH